VRLACVVQRYGADIAGGSEAHCREFAERLAAHHDVTVLTTCARDYITWKNVFPAGESRAAGVRVRRFPVRQTRRLKRFAEISDIVFDGPAPESDQEAWFRENGPDAPALLDHLREHGRDYDLVLFWTFRYAPSFFGVPLVQDRAILVPTAEEDRALDLTVLHGFLRRPAGYLFLTPEERAFVSARAGLPLEPSAVVGMGLEPAPPHRPEEARRMLAAHGVPEPFVLYLGRVDRNKGCGTLLEYFTEYALERDHVTLVLAGPAAMQLPSHPRIRALGYVPHAVRDALLSTARALIVPSPYESLSIALLEGWNHHIPALVNAHCSVLRGQVRRADGGLYYRTAREFAAALDLLVTDPHTRDALGRQGRAYVDRNYRWPTVLATVERLLHQLRQRGADTRRLERPESLAE
jgi:glycosyltransferase involved in cell wall biosynthesis